MAWHCNWWRLECLLRGLRVRSIALTVGLMKAFISLFALFTTIEDWLALLALGHFVNQARLTTIPTFFHLTLLLIFVTLHNTCILIIFRVSAGFLNSHFRVIFTRYFRYMALLLLLRKYLWISLFLLWLLSLFFTFLGCILILIVWRSPRKL